MTKAEYYARLKAQFDNQYETMVNKDYAEEYYQIAKRTAVHLRELEDYRNNFETL